MSATIWLLYVPFLECLSHVIIRINFEEEVEKFGEKKCSSFKSFFNKIVIRYKSDMMIPIKYKAPLYEVLSFSLAVTHNLSYCTKNEVFH